MSLNIDQVLCTLYNHASPQTLDELPIDDLALIICALVPEATIEHRDAIEDRIAAIRRYREKLAELRAVPLIAQRSDEWYELRKQRLTASDIAQAIGKGKFGSRSQLIQKKAAEVAGKAVPFRQVPAMKWGIMFEHMAMRCYQQRNDNIAVYEFGLIPHPTLDCFGASPDGITELGIMTEIKCPFKRKITGEVPDYYELQMQGQMAVCGLHECDYIECDMQEYDNDQDYFDAIGPTSRKDHGVICEFTKDGGDTFYEYSDPLLTCNQASAWAREYSSRLMRFDDTIQLTKIHYWRLREISITRIVFDETRWEEIVPQIRGFWHDVLKESVAPSRSIDIDTDTAKPVGEKKKYKFIKDDDED